MSRLLVATPTLGRSLHFAAACASLRALGDVATHVIVAPAAVHAGLREIAPFARLVDEPARRGLYAALNLAFGDEPAGDVFTYLNDDDLLCSRGVAVALDAMNRTRADIVYGRVRLIGADGASLGWLPVARRPGDLAALLARGIIPFAQPGTLLRRALVDSLGGFDASYQSAGDLDFFVRALRAGARFCFVDHEVAAFRLHAGQLSKNEDVAAREKERALAPLRSERHAAAGALLRFRLANLPAYVGRFRRFGWKRMATVYRHA